MTNAMPQLAITSDGGERDVLTLAGVGSIWQQAHESQVPPGAVRPPVYVSCPIPDRERIVKPLVEWLEQAGYTVWGDSPSHEDPASQWAATGQLLGWSTVLIVALTPDVLHVVEPAESLARLAHQEALRHFVPVIPVLLEPCSLPGYLAEYGLAPVDLTREEGWGDLGAALSAVVHRQGAWLADQTPVADRRFVGREAELAEVVALLRRTGQERLVVAIHGMGGVGKTMLAAELARRLGPRYPGGVLFERRGSEPPLIQYVLGRWAELAGHPSEPEQPSGGDYAWLESVGQLLVVLDDVWPEDVVKMRRLLDTLPADATCILTTRDENLAELLGTRVYRLRRYLEADGISLLQDRLGDGRDQGLLQSLHHAIEGHPLALELAAGRFRHYDQEALSEAVGLLAVRVERGDLTPLEIDLPGMRLGRDDSVLVCLRGIREMLAQVAPVMLGRFAALGTFAPGTSYDRGALAAVWGRAQEPLSLEETNQTIECLVEYALLGAAAGRYTQHPILHAYARAILNQSEEVQAAVHHRDHYVGLARFHATRGGQPSRHDVENFYHAARFTFSALGPETIDGLGRPSLLDERPEFDQQTALAVLALVGAARSEVQRLGLPVGHCWMRAGLAAARLLERQHDESVFLNELAGWHRERGEVDLALAYLAQSRLLDQTLNNRAGLAATLRTMGEIYQEAGQYDQALACYRRVLPYHQEMDDQVRVADTSYQIGLIYHAADQSNEALKYFKSALSIQEEVGDQAGQAITLTSMGFAYQALGWFDQAITCYEQAGAALDAIGDQAGQAEGLGHSGSLFLEIGSYHRALRYFQNALAIWEEQGNLEGLAAAHSHLGQVYQSMGDYAAALEQFDLALGALDRSGDRVQAIGALNSMGAVYGLLGEVEQAVAHYERALALARELGDWPAVVATLANIAASQRNAPESGHNEEAVAALREAIMLMELHGIRHDSGGGDLTFYRQQLAYWEWQDTLSLPLGRALRSFAEANGIDQQHSLLESHPELLTPEADDLFDVFINHLKLQQKTDALRRYIARRNLLQRCRAMGIDQAFRRA